MSTRRGCSCDRVRRGEPFTRDQCPHCWAFWHVERVNKSRGGSGALPTPVEPLATDLPHPPERSYPPVGRRHLAYHLCPVRDRWQRGVERLWRSRDLFDGTIVFAVAVGGKARGLDLDPPAKVRQHLPPGAVVIEVPHNPRIAEVASWEPLWERILQDAGENDVALYAHSKGVTRPGHEACRLWTDTLYDLALDHWGETERLLRRFPLVGSFKKHSREGFPAGSQTTWHYSGTFYWVRLCDFVERPWRSLRQQWAATESWVGEAYHQADGGVLFGEGDHRMNLYDPGHWRVSVLPNLEMWRSVHPPETRAMTLADPLYIVTPMTRPQNLSRIAETVAALPFDVRWVVIPAGRSPSYGGPERMRAFEAIPPNAWVWCLDDDTVVHPEFGQWLARAASLNPCPGRIVFGQANADGTHRLDPEPSPTVGTIDTGQVVFRRRLADGIEWGPEYDADGRFFEAMSMWDQAGHVACVPHDVTIYNALA